MDRLVEDGAACGAPICKGAKIIVTSLSAMAIGKWWQDRIILGFDRD